MDDVDGMDPLSRLARFTGFLEHNQIGVGQQGEWRQAKEAIIQPYKRQKNAGHWNEASQVQKIVFHVADAIESNPPHSPGSHPTGQGGGGMSAMPFFPNRLFNVQRSLPKPVAEAREQPGRQTERRAGIGGQNGQDAVWLQYPQTFAEREVAICEMLKHPVARDKIKRFRPIGESVNIPDADGKKGRRRSQSRPIEVASRDANLRVAEMSPETAFSTARRKHSTAREGRPGIGAKPRPPHALDGDLRAFDEQTLALGIGWAQGIRISRRAIHGEPAGER